MDTCTVMPNYHMVVLPKNVNFFSLIYFCIWLKEHIFGSIQINSVNVYVPAQAVFR